MESYEEWDMTIPPIPPRSRFYRLEPIGIGTPYVESLTSYITRLAEDHHVFPGILISKEIFPLVPGYMPSKRQYGVFVDGSGQSMTFNGVGLPANYAVQALENLTSHADLSYLTCLPLAGILSTKAKLIRKSKAWCSVCYEDQQANSQIIYEPLLWSFQAVSICSRHRIYLSTRCPYQNCAKPLPGIGWRSRVGYCSYCQRWLGSSLAKARKIASVDQSEMHWQLWVVSTLGDVLALIPSQLVPLTQQRLQQVVAYIIQSISSGNTSGFARSVGMSRNMIDYWRQGKTIPEINMLLQFCFRLELSLCDFLYLELNMLRPKLRNSVSLKSIAPQKKSKILTEAVYRALKLIVECDEYPPPTLGEVALRIGHCYDILKKVNPSACKEITNRHKDYILQRKAIRYQQLQGEVKDVVLRLCSEGVIPTQKRVALLLPRSGILRDLKIREYLQKISQEL